MKSGHTKGKEQKILEMILLLNTLMYVLSANTSTCYFAGIALMFPSTQVLDTLLTVESTPISVSTSRKISIFISRIQMSISSKMVHDDYIPLLLHGIVGILYNRFSDLWPPALDCLAVLVSKHKELVWSRFVQFVATHQSKGPIMKNQEKMDAATQPQCTYQAFILLSLGTIVPKRPYPNPTQLLVTVCVSTYSLHRCICVLSCSLCPLQPYY